MFGIEHTVDNYIFHGLAGSKAEEYAHAACRQFVAMGDFGQDGEINVSDAMNLYGTTSGDEPVTDSVSEIGDITFDGKVDIEDALKLYLIASAVSE